MAINVQAITKNVAHGDLWAFVPKPAVDTKLAMTNGVPTGPHVLYLGATRGESVGVYTPEIRGEDVEQVKNAIAHHLVSEVCSIRATLLEPNFRNLELVSSQPTIKNFLPGLGVEHSFEVDTNADGTADGWAAQGTSTRTLQADPATGGGTQAQQFITAGGVAGGIKSIQFGHPRLIAGTIVVLSGYAKAGAATPNLTWKLQAYDASNVAIGGGVTQVQVLSTSYARNAGLAYTLPALTAFVEITIHDATGQDITVKVDNVQLEVVASGSTPSAYVHNPTLFFGGRDDVLTFPVALTWQQRGTAKYSGYVLLDAYVTGGLTIAKRRTEATAFPIEFMGLPDPTRAAGKQYSSFFEDQ
jgi:hypothetical protein